MKKIILSILALLIIAGGGTAYYFLKVKTYDLSQDTVLEDITEEEYEIELPPNDSSVDSVTGSAPEGGTDAPAEVEGNPQNKGGEADTAASTGTENSEEKVTPQSIKDRYRPSFESLEAQANSKINALAGRAFNEYKEKKANGEKISYSYFLTKYKTAGEALEAKTDQAFNKLYAALLKDLKTQGFDPKEAEEIRATYEATKKERRNILLTMAMEKL